MNEQTYAILEQIYMELFDMFNFDDFHFGGTDISFKCWNSSLAVTSYMTQREDLSSLDEAGEITSDPSDQKLPFDGMKFVKSP